MGAFRHIPGLWLDVTRLLTRVGRGSLTGIDRVELAYIREALDSDVERYLCRTTRGYLLLDASGARCLVDLAEGTRRLGQADLLSRLTFRGARPRHRAEAALRDLAVDRCRPGRLRHLLARRAAPGLTYLNVGHSNLSEETLSAVSSLTDARVAVLIHDLIPLTHPQFVAESQPAKFSGRIERVRRYASHVICNSEATQSDLSTHWQGTARQPVLVTAPLGVERREGGEAERVRTHFVMLGTIEPRKNHAVIVDAWEMLADEMPHEDLPQLHIIGAEGWRVDALMARLRAHTLTGRAIHLHGALPDSAVQDHLARATALLFPSLAEGYGYPPLEAALAGAVPICSNLPVFRETLGDCAVYVDNGGAYQWKETIKQHLSGTGQVPDLNRLTVPTWQEHFETVAKAIDPRTTRGRP